MRKFFNDIKENVSKQDISKKYSIEQFCVFRKKERTVDLLTMDTLVLFAFLSDF